MALVFSKLRSGEPGRNQVRSAKAGGTMYPRCRFTLIGIATVVVAWSAPAVADQASSPNEAQNTVPQPEKKEKEKKEKVQEILVTGSLIKENISDISVPTALPLTVVTAD